MDTKPTVPAVATISRATVADLRATAGDLFKAHWREVAPRPELMIVEPQWESYERLEAAGMLTILIAQDEGKLVGYSVSVTTRHMHFGDLIYAHNDLLYVAPEARAHGVGASLILATERAVMASGARLLVWHTRPGHALETILIRRGYTADFVHYARELTDG